MIPGNFLRRIEPNPTTDLAHRQDLLILQFDTPLNWAEWQNLVQAPSELLELFQRFFSDTYNLLLNPEWFDTNDWPRIPGIAAHRYRFTNMSIFELCFLNRMRAFHDLPPISFNESQWAEYAAQLVLGNITDQVRMITNAVRE
jgi:hypothetical protein